MTEKILLSFLIFTCLSTVGQNNSLGKSDPEAKKILEAVSARFKTYQTVSVNFSLKIESTNGEVVGTESGTMQMKDDKYRIITADRQIFSDGKTIWAYEIADRKVQITNYDPASDVITPQKMFTDFYDNEYLYKTNDDVRIGNKSYTQIEMTPLDKTTVFFKLLINIDKASNHISSFKVFEKNGNRYNYTITSLQTNTDLSDNLFVFNTKNYPNVEVVDLR